MKKQIYIRADGDSQIGLGHLVRCMALAQMLTSDFEICFVSKQIPQSLINELNQFGFSLLIIINEDEFFRRLEGKEIVILDHYELDSIYQKTIKNFGSKLICIDDLHNK